MMAISPAIRAIPFGSLAEKGTEHPAGSISDAVAAWQHTDLQVAGRHDGRRNRLLAKIRARRGIVDGRIRSIEKQQESVRAADRYREWGEAIYAHLWEIEPGQTALVIEGESIPLDPLRLAKDVATDYFETYRRMQRGTGEVAEHLGDARAERDYLDQLETMTLQASTFPEIESVLAEWYAYAGPEKGEQPKKRKQPSDRIRPIHRRRREPGLHWPNRAAKRSCDLRYRRTGRLVAARSRRAGFTCHCAGQWPRAERCRAGAGRFDCSLV